MSTSRQPLSTNSTNNDRKNSANNNTATEPSCNTNEYFRFFQCIYENTDPERPIFNSCIDEYKKSRNISK